MKKGIVGSWAALLFCGALAGGQNEHDNNKNVPAAEPVPSTNISAYDIQATNAFVGTDWFVPNPGNTHNTHIHMADGLVRLSSDAAVAPQMWSWSIGPDVQLMGYQATAVWGHFTILNYGNGPGLDLNYCTGLNNARAFQEGCDIANNSSDSVGEIWLVGGVAGASTSGTVQVVFGGTAWPSTPYCQLTLKDEAASWGKGATAKIIAPLGGRTPREGFTVAWDNNGAPLAFGFNGPGVGIQYFCVAAP